MQTIEPARLKPGVTLDLLPAPDSGPPAPGQAARTVRGRALVFWDPRHPPGSATPKKLDAIDTDQITPAADCVSESLETLDERWKAGSFRYLMPDFRARVHRGETFLVAGDRREIRREVDPKRMLRLLLGEAVDEARGQGRQLYLAHVELQAAGL